MSAHGRATRKSPLAKARERIAELEELVDELLDDIELFLAMERLDKNLQNR